MILTINAPLWPLPARRTPNRRRSRGYFADTYGPAPRSPAEQQLATLERLAVGGMARAFTDLIVAAAGTSSSTETTPTGVAAPEASAEPLNEVASLWPLHIADAIGCSEKTLLRRIKAGWFTSPETAPIEHGLDSVRRRWFPSQLPAIRAENQARAAEARAARRALHPLPARAEPVPRPVKASKPKAAKKAKHAKSADAPPVRLIDRVKAAQ